MNLANRVLAPLTAAERHKLAFDIVHMRQTADRKGCSLNDWDEREEREAAKSHFELGCWLFYYSRRIYSESVDTRIDCARRIFIEGIANPGYRFFTVFDFGERQFDTLFEMGDAEQVVDGLRRFLYSDSSGNLSAAFRQMGWPISAPDLLSV